MVINSWAEVWYGYDSRLRGGYSIWLNKKTSIKLCRETLSSSEVLTVIFQVLSKIVMHLCSISFIFIFKKMSRYLDLTNYIFYCLCFADFNGNETCQNTIKRNYNFRKFLCTWKFFQFSSFFPSLFYIRFWKWNLRFIVFLP